ncbi:MAG: universal stress protein [Deinococcota bacterium]
MIESILLAVDVSDVAAVCGDYAVHIAARLDARVHCLYVLDQRLINMPHWTDYGAVSLPTMTFKDDMQALLDTQADLALGRFRDKADPAGITFELQKRDGIPARTILEQVRVNDLLMIGRRGESNQLDDSLELGSTAEKILRRSHCPVLVTPGIFTPISRIVLGFDGSERASATMRYAVEFAKRLTLPLTTVSVGDDAEVSLHLKTVQDYAHDHNINLTTQAASGNPADEILDLASPGDLIAIGAFGSNRLREFFLGSTTEMILKRAVCPVLLHR